MSSTKFTPGPWRLGDKGPNGGVNVSSLRWVGLAHVFVYMDGEKEPDAEGQANAYLIKTSPELYETLETLLPYFDDGSDEHRMISTALKKARGE